MTDAERLAEIKEALRVLSSAAYKRDVPFLLSLIERQQAVVDAARKQASAEFQRETLRTSALMRIVQWASARYADAHVSSWGHKTQHAPGQFFDDCESCWFREVAADLRSRDTDTVLADVSAALDRGPGLPAAALDRLDAQEAEA